MASHRPSTSQSRSSIGRTLTDQAFIRRLSVSKTIPPAGHAEPALLVHSLLSLVNNAAAMMYQSGFRGNYSTDSCLIHLSDHIHGQTSKGLFTELESCTIPPSRQT
ncbi:hypothetical protein DPMN_130639 [Dreissena polymorpha]|uniref:Uncharacterized protein n=1 Tax=Dreissena polymorpha TaxID=45954 RepID=A0A9D4H730_DREPO|nr:hypothetical protein DPMN_130639 [Dreissena polymorpha]